MECKIGEMTETFNGLIQFLADELRYRAPVTATRSVGRPSFIITKERLENNALVWFIVDGHSEDTWHVKIFVCYISNTRKHVLWAHFVRRKGCGLVLVWV